MPRYGDLPLLKECVGKTITAVALEEHQWEMSLKFSDGTQLGIDVRGNYCDDAWLIFKWLGEGEEAESL